MAVKRAGGLQVPFDATGDPRKYVYLTDEFVGGLNGTLDDTNAGIGALGFKVTDVVGAADSDVDIVTTQAKLEGHPGIISLNTGPTTPAAADEAGLTLKGAVTSDGTVGQIVYVGAQVQFPSVTAVEFNFGLFAPALGAGRDTDSISFELDVSASALLRAVAVKSSSATDVSTGLTPVIDVWYTLEIVWAGKTASFFVNGDFITEIATANVPNDVALVPGFKVTTETTAEKSVLIDWFALKLPVNRQSA